MSPQRAAAFVAGWPPASQTLATLARSCAPHAREIAGGGGGGGT